MNFAKIALLGAALAIAPAAASAQDVGTTIFGNDGQPVGTVESNDGNVVVVDTGTYKAPLPASALGELEQGWTVAATQAQINGMMAQIEAQANARRDAALLVGAPVMTMDNMQAGTILTIDAEADAIVVSRGEAGVVTLAREHFRADDADTLSTIFTLEEIAANTVEVPEGAQIVTSSEAPGEAAAGASE